MWLNLSAAITTESDLQHKYAEYRDLVEKKMGAKQIFEAQELARKCTANKFKGC
jgi:uncharacterized protein YktA (UPF0223 family)